MNITPKTKTKTITIRIDEDLHNALNEQAQKQSKTTSNLIRDILGGHNAVNYQSGNDELKNVHREAEIMRDHFRKSIKDSAKYLDSLNQYVEATNNHLSRLSDGVNNLDVTKIKRIGLMNVMSFVFLAISVTILLISIGLFVVK